MAKSATVAKPTSFASVLDMPSGDIERPKPLPPGSYVAVVQGQPRQDKSAKKQTEFVEYTLKLLEAQEDVDTDALKEIGGIADKTIKSTYYLTENSVWRLKEFLEHCGVEMDESTSLRQLIGEAAGCQVLITIAHEASQDGSAVFAKVKNTAAVG